MKKDKNFSILELNELARYLMELKTVDISQLIKILYKEYNVEPLALPYMDIIYKGAIGNETPEFFDLILINAGGQKLRTVKFVKEITGLGLKESKELTDIAPSILLQQIPKSHIDYVKYDIVREFTSFGAIVELVEHDQNRNMGQSPDPLAFKHSKIGRRSST